MSDKLYLAPNARVDWRAGYNLMAEAALDRPELSRGMTASEFASWYWIKTELVAFCRILGVSARGSKPEVAARILAELGGTQAPKATPRRPRGRMAESFSLETTIGVGWSCNPRLGKFFQSECGRTFRFNAAVRMFIHTQVGQSLAADGVVPCATDNAHDVSCVVFCQKAAASPTHTDNRMPRDVVFTENAAKPPASYSQAVRAAGLVFVSGTAPSDPVSGAFVGSTVQEQTRQCLKNIAAILDAAGTSLDNVVSVTIVLADEDDFAGMNEEYIKWFPSNPPARQGAKLPARIPGLKVSIAAIAEA